MIASGSITITNITDGLTTFYQYAKTTSDSIVPTTGWSATMPSSEPGKFIWRREAIALALEDVGEEDWGNEMCLTGATGTQGPAGYATGLEVQYALGTIDTPPQTVVIGEPGWALGQDYWIADHDWTSDHIYPTGRDDYIWMRSRTYDPGTDTYSAWAYVRLSGPPTGSISPEITSNGSLLIVSSGVLYAERTELDIPYYYQDLGTYEGQGYVALVGDDVVFVRMILNQNQITYEPYTGGSTVTVRYLIGKFKKSGSAITEISLLQPTSTDTFNKERFMEVLANRDWGEFGDWAEALGVTQIFQSLAAWDFFADNIRANRIYINSGGLKFEVSPDGYNGQYAIIKIMDSSNNVLFSIDGQNKKLTLNPTGGTWRGDLDVKNSDGTTVLKTQLGYTGATVASSPSGSLYSISALKSGSGVAISTTPANASGSYAGKTISKACYREASGKLQFGSLSANINSNSTTYPNYETWLSGALGTRLGAGKVKITVTGSYAGSAYLKRNGSQVAGWNGSGTAYFEFDYNSADYYQLGVKKRVTYSTTYYYDWEKYEAYDVGGETFWMQIDSGRIATSSPRNQGSLPDSAPEGTKKTLYFLDYTDEDEDYWDNTASITMIFESTYSYSAGFVFVNSDGSFSTIPYLVGYMDHDTNPITLNSWASSSYASYISGSDLIATFASSFPTGQTLPVSSGSSSVSSYYPVGASNSPLSSIASVTNNGSSITFTSAGGVRTVYAFGGNGSSEGVYHALSASVVKVTQPAGMIVESLSRANANVAIGASGSPFFAVYAQNIYGALNGNLTGNVNSSSNYSSYKVWGAVAN